MANKTVVFTNYFLNGTSGLTLLLLDPETAAIGNGAGDTLTAGSNGLFSAVVTENITGWWNVVVLQGAVVVLEGGKVYFQSNTVGTYQVDDATHAADAIHDEMMVDHAIDGSYGAHFVRSANHNQNTVLITGSQHIAASIHESEPNSIHETAFDSSSLTARILATDAVAEIQSGLASQSSVDTLSSYVDTEVAAIKAKTDLLPNDPASMTSIVAAFTEIKGTGWSSATDTLEKIAEHANDPLDEEDVAILVFQALVGSAVARSALPTSATPLETLKYIDYDLDITASTAASSKLVVSIGCENHSNPNIEIDNETGLLRLNAKTDFQAAWATLTRVSPTLVRVHINAIAMKELVVGEYLLELREITVDDKVILRREYQFFVRSGAGRIIG